MDQADRDRHFQPVRVSFPSEEVARRIAAAIRTGFFRPGSSLPSERRMAEQMQVSRPTVREAVKLLVSAGLLTVKPGAGGAPLSPAKSYPWTFLMHYPEQQGLATSTKRLRCAGLSCLG